MSWRRAQIESRLKLYPPMNQELVRFVASQFQVSNRVCYADAIYMRGIVLMQFLVDIDSTGHNYDWINLNDNITNVILFPDDEAAMTNSKTNIGRTLAGGGIEVTEWQLSVREVSILAAIVGEKPIVAPHGGGNKTFALYLGNP